MLNAPKLFWNIGVLCALQERLGQIDVTVLKLTVLLKGGSQRLFNHKILILFEIDFSFERIRFGEPSSHSQCSERFLSLLHRPSPFLIFTFYSLFNSYSVRQ